MRVQIPAYTDRWMMGDCFGVVIKVERSRKARAGIRAALLSDVERAKGVEIAHVRLDKSGKTVRVILNDQTALRGAAWHALSSNP